MFGNEIEVPFSADFFQKSLVGQWMKAVLAVAEKGNVGAAVLGKSLYFRHLKHVQLTLNHQYSAALRALGTLMINHASM